MGVHPLGRWWRDVQPPYMEQFYASPPAKFGNSYFRWAGLPSPGSIAEHPQSGSLLLVAYFSAGDLVSRCCGMVDPLLIAGAALDGALQRVWACGCTAVHVCDVAMAIAGT